MQQSVLICLESIDCVEPNLNVVGLLGLNENVHLIGTHTIPGIHYSPRINPDKLHDLYVEIQKKHKRDAGQIKALFEANSRAMSCKLSYIEKQGVHVFDYAPYWHAARFADFVVCTHLPSVVPEISLQRELILHGGAPVIVPSSDSQYAKPKSISECDIGILWNGRVDCARAVRAAASFLAHAKSVEIRIDPMAEFEAVSNSDVIDLSALEEFLERTHIHIRSYANAPSKANAHSDILVLGASSYLNNQTGTEQNGTMASFVSS